MFRRSWRLIAAVPNLDCFSRDALKGENVRKLGATLSTSSGARDSKSANYLYFSVFGFLGLSLCWSKRKIFPPINLPVAEALPPGSDDDIPMSKRFAEVIEKAIPAIVHIETYQQTNDMKPKWGSGFIVDKRGYILTNAHVIANASYISVRLHSGETLPATVIDVDQVADLALIKLEGSYKQNLPALKFGKSDEVRPGEWVIALGSPLARKNTITSGTVSMVGCTSKELGLNRSIDMEYIKTDVTITDGNSGGPLVNLDGEVVGINTMISFSPGISFAIPSQVAKDFISAACKTSPKEKPKKYAVGMTMRSLSPQLLDSLRSRKDIPMDIQKGVFISNVWPDSPASKAGLQENDIIIKIDGTPVTSSSQVESMVQKGKPFNITVRRGLRKPINITVTPEDTKR